MTHSILLFFISRSRDAGFYKEFAKERVGSLTCSVYIHLADDIIGSPGPYSSKTKYLIVSEIETVNLVRACYFDLLLALISFGTWV